VFGVLTKIDAPFTSEENEYQEFISRIKMHLGILDIHLLRCTNYCDVNLMRVQDEITSLPEIDLPILRGLQQVTAYLNVSQLNKSTANST
jgi:hypothetical protein